MRRREAVAKANRDLLHAWMQIVEECNLTPAEQILVVATLLRDDARDAVEMEREGTR